MNSQIKDRFDGNISRIRNLIKIYEREGGSGRGRKAVGKADILRAAVVLLHAAVEDVLRSLERRTLPKADFLVLKDIPLAGTDRRSSFHLGDLGQHRGKKVEEIIDLSVEQHLERATYNNTDQLAAVIRRLGSNPDLFSQWFRAMNNMMQRRHKIVHRADRNEARGSGNHSTASIKKEKVSEWIEVAQEFVNKLFEKVPDIEGPSS